MEEESQLWEKLKII